MDLPEQSERIIAHFGLKFDPFGSLVDTMVFSGACGRYETVETVRHLLAYSQQDGLISGVPGAGKRMVAQQVIKLLEDEWRVCWIDGSDTDTPEILFQEIIGQLGLGIKLGGSNAESVKKIVEVCAARSETEESFLILVQFADRMSEAIAGTLMQFRQQAISSDSRIRQLWLCNDLESLPIDVFDDDWYHHALTAFDDAAAEQYLKDRFVAAGHIGDLPIPEKDVARLNQMAKGLPMKLNELATDYLISATFRTAEKKQKFPITHLVAGLAALSLVVIAFLYQTSDGPEIETEVAEPSGSVTPSAVEQKLAEAVARVEAQQAPPPLEPDVVEPPAVIGTDQPLLPTAQPEPQQLPAPAATPVPAPAQPAAQPTRLLTRGDNAEFTMQLIGVRDRARLDPLIAKFSDRNAVDVVQTTYQGRPWFVLIYGQFPTRALAQSASSSLPSDFAGQELWIRTFAAVRQDAN